MNVAYRTVFGADIYINTFSIESDEDYEQRIDNTFEAALGQCEENWNNKYEHYLSLKNEFEG